MIHLEAIQPVLSSNECHGDTRRRLKGCKERLKISQSYALRSLLISFSDFLDNRYDFYYYYYYYLFDNLHYIVDPVRYAL